MKNKFYEGLTIKQVGDEKKWGLIDNRSGEFLPGCFSRREDGIKDVHDEAHRVLGSSLESIKFLRENQWSKDDDNYLSAMFLDYWLRVNPHTMLEINEALDKRKAQKAAEKSIVKPKGKRGRPRKNPEDKVVPKERVIHYLPDGTPRKRGRPRKNPLPETPGTITVEIELLGEPGRGETRFIPGEKSTGGISMAKPKKQKMSSGRGRPRKK